MNTVDFSNIETALAALFSGSTVRYMSANGSVVSIAPGVYVGEQDPERDVDIRKPGISILYTGLMDDFQRFDNAPGVEEFIEPEEEGDVGTVLTYPEGQPVRLMYQLHTWGRDPWADRDLTSLVLTKIPAMAVLTVLCDLPSPLPVPAPEPEEIELHLFRGTQRSSDEQDGDETDYHKVWPLTILATFIPNTSTVENYQVEETRWNAKQVVTGLRTVDGKTAVYPVDSSGQPVDAADAVLADSRTVGYNETQGEWVPET